MLNSLIEENKSSIFSLWDSLSMTAKSVTFLGIISLLIIMFKYIRNLYYNFYNKNI